MRNVFLSILVIALAFSFTGQVFGMADNRLETTIQVRILDMIPSKANGQLHVSNIIAEIRNINITEEAEQALTPTQKNLLDLLRKNAKEVEIGVESYRLAPEKLQSLDAYCLAPYGGEWKGKLISEFKVLVIPTMGYESSARKPFIAILLDHQYPGGEPKLAVNLSVSPEKANIWFDKEAKACEANRAAIEEALIKYNKDIAPDHLYHLDLDILHETGFLKNIPTCSAGGLYSISLLGDGTDPNFFCIECSFHSKIMNLKGNDAKKGINIPEPNFDVNVKCAYCGGDGKYNYDRCPACGGDGWALSPDNPQACQYCGGDGKYNYDKCPTCNGTGWANAH